MSLVTFFVVVALVTGACVAFALAFSRALLYQNVLGELDVTRGPRPVVHGREWWRVPPRATFEAADGIEVRPLRVVPRQTPERAAGLASGAPSREDALLA